MQRTAGSAPARPRSRQALHVVVLGSYTRFPHGMATASRVRLVSRALVEAGDEVLVLCLQASERPPCIENTRLRGIHQGVAFEYTTWTTVRHDSFSMRRLIAAWGWAHGAWRLASLRYQGRLDLAYVWPDLVPSMRQVVGVGLLRLLGVPVVGELNERPWSLSHPRALGRFWSPLTGMSGVVSISGMLSAWARAEARRRHRDVEVIEVPILVDVEEQPVREYPVDDPPVVMFAGSPEYDETIKFILESMKQVWQKVPECRLVVTGANRHDVTQIENVLRSVVIPSPPGAIKHLCTDKAYTGVPAEGVMKKHGYIPHVRSRGEEAKAQKRHRGGKARRWIVECVHSWFNRFRKILVRYEKTVSSYLALLHLAAAIICWRKVGVIYG